MPFFNSFNDPQYYIDLNKLVPVAVVVNFANDGRMQPIYVRVVMNDESEETITIDGVQSHKEIPGGISYTCNVKIGNRQRHIILNYYVKNHIWYMAKF